MNSTLGVELPFTGALIQTTVPLGYIDPTTETIAPNETQLWKITHNGVDTHVIHFHLVNVQVVNRVGWDGAIRTVDENELGWKESVRMNPLEDCIVAMRARVPTYPFTVPNSIRPLNPAMPVGSTFASLNPITGGRLTVTNAVTNFGHEYVWHCHILGHEENDMMRALVLNPNAKTEILWRNTVTGLNMVWHMNGASPVTGAWLPTISDTNWTIVGVGDFNSDGKPDILWRNTTTGLNMVWHMNGANPVTGAWLPTIADTNWTIVGVGDFNSDGKPDILWRNTTTGLNMVWYMDGDNPVTGAWIESLPDLNWIIVGIGDFNSDVKPDILWRNTATGQNMVWYMDGATHTAGAFVESITDTNWAIVGR
jgi:hypothetical protein